MKPPHFRRLSVVLAVLLLPSLAAAQANRAEPKFLRFVPDRGGGGVLQTSVVTYQNRAGATVDLIGAVHIADASYFRQLNKNFEQYDSLLYELIKPAELDLRARGRGGERQDGEREGAPRAMAWVGMIQQFLKTALELSFQLDEIDYTKANFVHADLDAETFARMQADRGESLFTLMLQQMLNELARTSNNPNAEVMDTAGLILALQSPDRARQLKLVLGRQFNQMEEMMAGLGGPNGSVILTERNRAALTVLRNRLEAGEKKLGVFYGAAHLNEMEKDLTGLMGFRQVGEPKWITAWDMSTPAARPATQAVGAGQ